MTTTTTGDAGSIAALTTRDVVRVRSMMRWMANRARSGRGRERGENAMHSSRLFEFIPLKRRMSATTTTTDGGDLARVRCEIGVRDGEA